jgi:Amino acid permease
MPLTESEREIVEAETDLDAALQRYDNAPTPRQKLGWFSVVCLILNRTIGSGIFVTPSKVLAGTGSISGSLFFWAAGAVISTCGLLVWLECSLSIPQRPVRGETEPRGVPRSGGEKNYV